MIKTYWSTLYQKEEFRREIKREGGRLDPRRGSRKINTRKQVAG